MAQEPGTKLWEFAPSDGFAAEISSPAIGADGTIYFTERFGNQGTLYAVDARGSNLWKHADNYQQSPILAPDGTVYAVDGPAALRAKTPDGTPKWVLDCAPSTSLAVAGDGVVYFCGLSAITPQGTTKWTLGDYPASYPTIGLNGVVYYLGDRSMRAVISRGSSGKILNAYFYVGNEAICHPAIGADGTLYCGYQGGKFCAVNPDLSRKWLFDLGQPQSAIIPSSEPAIAADGTIYFGTADGRGNALLFCLIRPRSDRHGPR
jgi:outer membrane protein assembly factor BamB